jgi:hypothetical protein
MFSNPIIILQRAKCMEAYQPAHPHLMARAFPGSVVLFSVLQSLVSVSPVSLFPSAFLIILSFLD